MAGEQLEHVAIRHYEVIRHLEAGGMSSIYLAYNKDTQENVVFKMVAQDIPGYSERFLREARALLSLHHPHILPALDYGKHESWYYLVTPYIAAGSLRKYLEQKKMLDIRHAGRLLSQLTSAVEYAHQRGILHRDIKAANVLMRDPEYIYLADFGLAKSEDDDVSLTQSGYLIDTPDYMAPELMEGEATAASDVYAIGVLLFYMLTGVMPFKGSTPMSVMLKHLNAPVPFPRDIKPDIPRPIELVLLTALSKNPRDRYQSASELLVAYYDALEEVDRTQPQLAAISTAMTLQRAVPMLKEPASTLMLAGVPSKRVQGLARAVPSYPHPRMLNGVGVMGACLLGVILLAANVNTTNADSVSQSHKIAPVAAFRHSATATPTPHTQPVVVQKPKNNAIARSSISSQRNTRAASGSSHVSQSNGSGQGEGNGNGSSHGKGTGQGNGNGDG